MGWFGVSANDKPDWKSQFQTLLARIRPDQFVAIVDCHI